MAEKGTLSQEEMIQKLNARIDALENELDEKKKENSKEKNSHIFKKAADSLSESSTKVINETGKILGSMVDATAEAMKEAANALTSLSDDVDKEKLGDVPAAMVSVLKKTIDIQKKALDKFEESYDNYDK